ncbi:MAG: DAK2 domain-containing protein, partial [Dehalococcoidia bacterium]
MSDDDNAAVAQLESEQAPAEHQIGGQRLRAVFVAASAWLERNAEAINAINVFPVPDGDTGSNMAATLRDTVGQVGAGLQSAGEVTAALAKHALMAARGNSGVIFSQLLRGFADATAGLERLDGPALAHAFSEGARTAYGALEKPVEGTILTVARAAGEAAESIRSADPRPVFEAALAGARAGLARTPDLLPVLRQAGVVDSGGFGLVVFLEGAVRFLRGEAAPDAVVDAGSIDATWLANSADHGAEGASAYGYCTEFIILSPGIDSAELRQRVAQLGDSLVVAGDSAATHVHVHTDDPGAAISCATAIGKLTRIKIENMQLQHEDLVRSRSSDLMSAPPAAESEAPAIATVFVVSGSGLADTARSLGATTVIAGGQTMNPSVEQILNAIRSAPSGQVIVLPNNKNVILSARQAVGLAEKDVRVVPTRSVPQGLAALLAFSADTEL